MKLPKTAIVIATIAGAVVATNAFAAAKSGVQFSKNTDRLTSYSLKIGRFGAVPAFDTSSFDAVGFWAVIKQSYVPSLADTTYSASTSAFSGLTAASGPSFIGGFSLDASPDRIVPPEVPEPGTVAGGCLAFGMLAFMQRRRLAQLFTSRAATA